MTKTTTVEEGTNAALASPQVRAELSALLEVLVGTVVHVPVALASHRMSPRSCALQPEEIQAALGVGKAPRSGMANRCAEPAAGT